MADAAAGHRAPHAWCPGGDALYDRFNRRFPCSARMLEPTQRPAAPAALPPEWLTAAPVAGAGSTR